MNIRGIKIHTGPTPTHDTARAAKIREEYTWKSYCFRCGLPWGFVKGHSTRYNETTSCFPLCESCWRECGSPEARIEYYKMLIDWWEEIGNPVTEDEKKDIQRAVANGG